MCSLVGNKILALNTKKLSVYFFKSLPGYLYKRILLGITRNKYSEYKKKFLDEKINLGILVYISEKLFGFY